MAPPNQCQSVGELSLSRGEGEGASPSTHQESSPDFVGNAPQTSTAADNEEQLSLSQDADQASYCVGNNGIEPQNSFTIGAQEPHQSAIVEREREREHDPPPSTSGARAQSCTTTSAQPVRNRRRFSEVARPYSSNISEVVGEFTQGSPRPAIIEREREKEREQAPPPSSSAAQAQSNGILLPAPHRRRRRWDQPPCCPTGEARLIMTCCRARLCRDCALVNPCGCRDWQQRRGFAVPMFPQHPVPDDCILDRPITLQYPTWIRIYAARNGDNVWFIYICLEDLIHRPQAVISQVHWFVTVARSWSRFRCFIYQGRRRICEFSYPPTSPREEEQLQDVVRRFRRRRPDA